MNKITILNFLLLCFNFVCGNPPKVSSKLFKNKKKLNIHKISITVADGDKICPICLTEMKNVRESNKPLVEIKVLHNCKVNF